MSAQAGEYGRYDPRMVISLTETAPGKPSVKINLTYLTQILNDLGSHAGAWPVNFDSIDDRRRAENDVTLLSNQLDIIADSFTDESMLLRLALLHTVGHNLDIPGSSEKAVAVFDKVLERWPNDPQASYQYGVFLAGTAQRREAIPLLEKAKALGVPDADYPLGLTYLSLGEKDKALENLESYTKRKPGDENAAKILDAVIHGRVEIKQLKSSP